MLRKSAATQESAIRKLATKRLHGTEASAFRRHKALLKVHEVSDSTLCLPIVARS
jgi:hypothetical protein